MVVVVLVVSMGGAGGRVVGDTGESTVVAWEALAAAGISGDLWSHSMNCFEAAAAGRSVSGSVLLSVPATPVVSNWALWLDDASDAAAARKGGPPCGLEEDWR